MHLLQDASFITSPSLIQYDATVAALPWLLPGVGPGKDHLSCCHLDLVSWHFMPRLVILFQVNVFVKGNYKCEKTVFQFKKTNKIFLTLGVKSVSTSVILVLVQIPSDARQQQVCHFQFDNHLIEKPCVQTTWNPFKYSVLPGSLICFSCLEGLL